jgi:hypothetical protein
MPDEARTGRGVAAVPGKLRGPSTLRGGSEPSACGAGDPPAYAPAGALGGRGELGALCRALGPRAGCGVPGRCWMVAGEIPEPGSGVVGITGGGVDGIGTGVTSCACGCASFAPVVIFCVGAMPFSPAESRAPHPPQNRESGSLWVPQLGQFIPSPSVTHKPFGRRFRGGAMW